MTMEKPYYSQQPMGTPQMSVQQGNRNAKNLPLHNGEREWSEGLCGCTDDCGTFCVACWFPCISYGKNKRRVDHLNSKGYPDPEHGGCCNSDCMVHGCLTGCLGLGWILQIGVRSNIRTRYSIKGGGCGDCMSAWCCAPCELTQGSREIELEEQSFSGHH
uniref:PLAC8 domain protein n=1 Tax=Strobilurus tenacellus TaxID=41251 RepID=A0A3B1EFP6_STRTC|nr:PLAC8 domain protein [Strobilurus tenacellus]